MWPVTLFPVSCIIQSVACPRASASSVLKRINLFRLDLVAELAYSLLSLHLEDEVDPLLLGQPADEGDLCKDCKAEGEVRTEMYKDLQPLRTNKLPTSTTLSSGRKPT